MLLWQLWKSREQCSSASTVAQVDQILMALLGSHDRPREHASSAPLGIRLLPKRTGAVELS